ncbi:MAG: hypothetical protein DDT42_00855 [candidate division WS2 bacterium]|uniref:Uncharacterized protein n=1 Tax=Psychracetigena formicireducens TaxID=2986056 RepID=A0A9E2BH74_PSYF1|nr:hypothetical protein [Candidatus Psychracetigena formicireducens]
MIEALEIKSKVIICIIWLLEGLYKAFGGVIDGKIKDPEIHLQSLVCR